MPNNPNVIPMNIVLGEQEKAIVDAYSRDAGINNRSGAIRQIIREWNRLKFQAETGKLKPIAH